MERECAGWDARVHQRIDSATDTKRRALYDRTPLEHWTSGRISLLGDSAHAILPFFGQGAAQAVEDAAVLADCLQDVGRDRFPDGPEQEQRDRELAEGDPLRQSARWYGYGQGSEGATA